jgi:hypothetical protein
MEQLQLCFDEINAVYKADPEYHYALTMIHKVVLSNQTLEMLNESFEFGK